MKPRIVHLTGEALRVAALLEEERARATRLILAEQELCQARVEGLSNAFSMAAGPLLRQIAELAGVTPGPYVGAEPQYFEQTGVMFLIDNSPLVEEPADEASAASPVTAH